LKVEIGRIKVGGQPGQKVIETPSQQTSWMWEFTSVILAMRRLE
jgi:hypothetical protein